MNTYLVLWQGADGINATPIPDGLFKEIKQTGDVEEKQRIFHNYRTGDYLEYKRNPEFLGKKGEESPWPFSRSNFKKVICL